MPSLFTSVLGMSPGNDTGALGLYEVVAAELGEELCRTLNSFTSWEVVPSMSVMDIPLLTMFDDIFDGFNDTVCVFPTFNPLRITPLGP